MVVVPFGLGGGRHQCLYPGSVLTPLPVVSGTFSTTNETPKDLSYAAAVKPRYGRNIDTSLLPSPGEQGGFPSIQLFDEDLEKGRDFCKHGLVGRLDLSKLKLGKVRSSVTNLWRLQGTWSMTPLGKGYIMFRFECLEDYQKVWDQGAWKVENQILRLSKWSPNFSTKKETQSHAAVWVRFPGLPLEYWEIRNLLALGRAVGRPIHMDETTAKRELGYYASVLVDIDLSKSIPEKVWIESKTYNIGFWQPIKLGKTPEFCSHCKGVGHTVANCKHLKNDLAKSLDLAKSKTDLAKTKGISESSTLILADNSTTLVPSISILQGQCTTNNDRMENDSHAMLGLGVEELPIPPVNIEQNVSTNFHIVGSDSLIVPPPATLVAPFIEASGLIVDPTSYQFSGSRAS
ncbi:hypothetical protein IFM89_004066 [Coptis chinensis]|uniref:DUF4283 domain-containing protein n=1 Tax=Coptis chinensis TaxID=261450 RepID=A0A835H2I9_9MAGN|nr:hypothetical protein IFM89_004066 [Coptis chinensis]